MKPETMRIAASLDIGGTHTEIALVAQNTPDTQKEREGRVLGKKKLATQSFSNIDAFCSAIQSSLGELVKQIDVNWRKQILGLGIGAASADFYSQEIQHGANLPQSWGTSIPLTEILHKCLQIPVIMDNDANVAALGEAKYGRTPSDQPSPFIVRPLILITIGTGLGCGIILPGNKVYRGGKGQAGELGHIIVVPDGRPHPRMQPKRYGTLESYVSNDGLWTTFQEISAEQKQAPPPTRPTHAGKKVVDLARGGNSAAIETLRQTGKILGLALANMTLLLDPAEIVLSGGISQAEDLLLEPTRQNFLQHLLPTYQQAPPVLRNSNLPANHVSLLGAAALLFHECLQEGQ